MNSDKVSANEVIKNITEINIKESDTSALENYLQSLKLLDAITAEVKSELKERLEKGEKMEKYELITRTARSVSDQLALVKGLRALGFCDDELFDYNLKSVTELIKLVGTKNRDKLNLTVSTSTHIKRKKGA